jgi:hypothetical protein
VFIIDLFAILFYTGMMQSREKIIYMSPDEVRFPTSKRFSVVCQYSTANKGQFNFAFVQGQIYQAYELIKGKDYIVWFAAEQYEAITGSTFKKYFLISKPLSKYSGIS